MVEALPSFEGCAVVRRVSRGPVTDLYQAVQQQLGRPVLIKALGESILPSSPFALTLEREARLLSGLDHPNLLKVYDFVRRDDRMWIVLEWVDGVSLEQVLESEGRLPLSASLAVALEVADALEHAHSHGVVHRDVRPGNIQLLASGQVKLINFSVAVDSRLPTAPELLGISGGTSSPSYLSPEQLLGEPADARSDLFSLGILLYQCLSGSLPFGKHAARSEAQRIRHERPEPLGAKVANLPIAVERAILRCLEKLPPDRFRSAQELGLALRPPFDEVRGGSTRRVLGEFLRALGLAGTEPAAPPSSELGQGTIRPAKRPPGLRETIGLQLLSLLVLSAGALLLTSPGARLGESPIARTSGLAETPHEPGFLRVIATPWARVSVNGVEVETTPFAQPIALSAGTHYVRLQHPDAPVEERTVQLLPGENLLLDVAMKVPPAPVSTTDTRPTAPVDPTP